MSVVAAIPDMDTPQARQNIAHTNIIPMRRNGRKKSYGVYDDFGGIERVKNGWNVKFILRKLGEDVIEKPVGDNAYCEPSVKKPKLRSILGVVKLIGENRLEVNGVGRQSIGLMMVHRWAYDLLTTSARMWFGEDRSLVQTKADGQIFYEVLCQNIAKEISAPENETARAKAMRELDNEMKRFRFKADEYFNHTNAFYGFSEYSPRLDGYQMVGIKTYRDLFGELAVAGKTKNDPEIISLIDELSRYFQFLQNFEVLRRTFMPQAGAGSHSHDLDLHAKLCLATSDYIVSEEIKWNE